MDAAELDRAIAETRAHLDELLVRFTERHPDVVYTRRELEDLLEQRRELPTPSVASPVAGVTPPPVEPQGALPSGGAPVPVARASRPVAYATDFEALCGHDGVLACFDFEARDAPLASRNGTYTGHLSRSSDGKIRARLQEGEGALGSRSLRMDFRPDDAADHGAFVVTLDDFGEGDRITVQWRQWFTDSLVTRFSANNDRITPAVGGGGAKQLGISEIGDPRGCSYSEIVASNHHWAGAIGLYHGCGLWFAPVTPAPIGPADASDLDMQPGGDNVCRYRYYRNGYPQGVDYLYPTVPRNLLERREFSAVVHPERYHGCLGWMPGSWITFRLEVDVRFCRSTWSGRSVPEACRDLGGRVRYWVKYADEKRPWLVIDFPMPVRWQAGHSERFGRFTFLPYNTGEQPHPGKPEAHTLYDEIVIARNVDDLPWPRE